MGPSITNPIIPGSGWSPAQQAAGLRTATQRSTDRLQIQALADAAGLPYHQAAELLGFDLVSANVGRGYDERALQLNHNADMARLGNSQYRDVDLARARLGDDMASAQRRYNTAYDISGRQYNDRTTAAAGAYGIDIGRLADQLGFAGRQYTNTERFLGAEGQIALRDRELGMQRADLGNSQARRAAANAAASQGAATSSGYNATQNELVQQLGLDRAGVTQAWNRQSNDLTRNLDSTRLGWDQAQSDNRWGNEQAVLTRDTAFRGADTALRSTRQDADNAYADAQADAVRQNQYIDSVAKDYGISRSQMEAAFKLGSDRLGFDYAQLIAKLTREQTNLNAQGRAASDALKQQILMAAQGAA